MIFHLFDQDKTSAPYAPHMTGCTKSIGIDLGNISPKIDIESFKEKVIDAQSSADPEFDPFPKEFLRLYSLDGCPLTSKNFTVSKDLFAVMKQPSCHENDEWCVLDSIAEDTTFPIFFTRSNPPDTFTYICQIVQNTTLVKSIIGKLETILSNTKLGISLPETVLCLDETKTLQQCNVTRPTVFEYSKRVPLTVQRIFAQVNENCVKGNRKLLVNGCKTVKHLTNYLCSIFGNRPNDCTRSFIYNGAKRLSDDTLIENIVNSCDDINVPGCNNQREEMTALTMINTQKGYGPVAIVNRHPTNKIQVEYKYMATRVCKLKVSDIKQNVERFRGVPKRMQKLSIGSVLHEDEGIIVNLSDSDEIKVDVVSDVNVIVHKLNCIEAPISYKFSSTSFTITNKSSLATNTHGDSVFHVVANHKGRSETPGESLKPNLKQHREIVVHDSKRQAWDCLARQICELSGVEYDNTRVIIKCPHRPIIDEHDLPCTVLLQVGINSAPLDTTLLVSSVNRTDMREEAVVVNPADASKERDDDDEGDDKNTHKPTLCDGMVRNGDRQSLIRETVESLNFKDDNLGDYCRDDSSTASGSEAGQREQDCLVYFDISGTGRTEQGPNSDTEIPSEWVLVNTADGTNDPTDMATYHPSDDNVGLYCPDFPTRHDSSENLSVPLMVAFADSSRQDFYRCHISSATMKPG
ncbi:uncharacterized protein [Ptychodera flava]|uniref:uncharacterized protein isoform X1 n=1 Tax=Ptychodera flava TaxID=63121 RepID=UPI00396A5ABD